MSRQQQCCIGRMRTDRPTVGGSTAAAGLLDSEGRGIRVPREDELAVKGQRPAQSGST